MMMMIFFGIIVMIMLMLMMMMEISYAWMNPMDAHYWMGFM
jgi:hypothetical protein